MILKSFSKINLSLTVNNRLNRKLHNIQSFFCLINLFDQIKNKKIKGEKDIIKFKGKFSKFIKKKKNSVFIALKILREQNLITDYYSVSINKKIPVFAGLGGGYVSIGDSVLLAIGTPAHESEIINNLAQNSNSIFGKIIKIKKSDLVNSSLEKVDYEIYTSGHRNPQGMTISPHDGGVYFSNHGPRGGDHIGKAKPLANYGWENIAWGGTEYSGFSIGDTPFKKEFQN